MSGTRRPSSSTWVFQPLKLSSSSSSSCPRRSSRTGCADSGLTRYWYQERSQATVTASSPETPESGTMLARASPRLFAIPPTVRRYALALKMSAASSTAISSFESRRRIGSEGATFSPFERERPRKSVSPRRRRRRSPPIVGWVGDPSLIQPCSTAVSWQSGQTCTSSAPSSGAKRTERSPRSSVRSQTAHCRSVDTFVTLTGLDYTLWFHTCVLYISAHERQTQGTPPFPRPLARARARRAVHGAGAPAPPARAADARLRP